MSELWINARGREIEATKDRTEIFRYIGAKAVYDHVAIHGVPAFRIFQHYEGYDLASQYCEENEYPLSTNQFHVPREVKWDFNRSITQEGSDIDEVYIRDELQ